MATTTEAVKDETKMKTKTNGGTAPATDEDFGEVVLDRMSFKPELFTRRDEKRPKIEVYDGPYVEGLWFAHRSLGETTDPENGKVRTMYAYFVKLTQPCKVADREDVVHDAKIGDEIMVWETAQLKQILPPEAANHPTLVAWLRMTPVHRAPHPTDPQKRMWTTRFAFNKKAGAVPRSRIVGGSSVVQAMLATLPKQLSSAEVPSLGNGAEVDLPF